jgi:hypothetical protein
LLKRKKRKEKKKIEKKRKKKGVLKKVLKKRKKWEDREGVGQLHISRDNYQGLPDSTQHCFYKQEGLISKTLLLPSRPMAHTH